MQQVALVNATGFSFVAHPSAFLVHRPHPKSEARGLYSAASTAAAAGTTSVAVTSVDSSAGSKVGGTAETDSVNALRGAKKGGMGNATAAKLFHRRVAAMRHVSLRDMRRGTYQPVVDEGSEKCKAFLDPRTA